MSVGMLPLATYLWFLIFEEIFQISARRFASKGVPCGICRGKLTEAATSGAARSSEHLFYFKKSKFKFCKNFPVLDKLSTIIAFSALEFSKSALS